MKQVSYVDKLQRRYMYVFEEGKSTNFIRMSYVSYSKQHSERKSSQK